jgi:Mrp family chromosome partitioning ATPase
MKIRPTEVLPPLDVPSITGDPVLQISGEVIKNLRHLVIRISKDKVFPERLSLVAALRGEGVTFLSRALAATLANDFPVMVCAVELNWWWPSNSAFVAPGNECLAAVLSGQASLEDVIVPTGWPNLAFIPAGKVAKQERPTLANSPALRRTIEVLGKRYDHIILDIPAIRATTDAVPLASLGTGCCQVIRQGATHIDDVRLALDEIDHLKIYGVLLNQVTLLTPSPFVKVISSF